MSEVINRVQKDPSVQDHPHLKPIVEALKEVRDVSNAQEVADALVDVVLPQKADNTSAPRPVNNPFAPR
jgi:hypothetical protein